MRSLEDLGDLQAVKRANPASWLTLDALKRQRESLPETVFGQFHANVWGRGLGAWLPPGAWAACRGDCSVEDGERLWIGVDVGGTRSASAVVGVTEDLRVAVCHVYEGDEAVLEVTQTIRQLAQRFQLVELVFDPWRYRSEALRLEQDEGLTTVEFPQSIARMVPASENLHRVIVQRELTHPGHPDLDRHVANAVAKQTPRGWRLDKASRTANIDGLVALAMACERAQFKEPPVEFLGWLDAP